MVTFMHSQKCKDLRKKSINKLGFSSSFSSAPFSLELFSGDVVPFYMFSESDVWKVMALGKKKITSSHVCHVYSIFPKSLLVSSWYTKVKCDLVS